MTKLTLFAATAALMLSVPFAYAADVSASTETKYKQGEDGSYESSRTSKRETEAGTSVKEQSKVDVEKNDDGTYKKTVTHETVNDPKGLMNKTKTKTVSEVESDKDEVTKSFKKEVNGDVVQDEKTVDVR